MGLLETNKAERRRRIIATARKLIARRGYAGLTMRELAEQSRVSVPTLYNLVGGKDAILAAELEETFARIALRVAASAGDDFVERAFAVYQAGVAEFQAAPGYYRELLTVFLTTPETAELRRRIEEQYMQVMAENLRVAQARGQLADWVDAETLSRHIFADYMVCFLGWAMGDLDDEGLASAAVYGLCLLLLGVARGDAAARLEARAKKAQQHFTRR